MWGGAMGEKGSQTDAKPLPRPNVTPVMIGLGAAVFAAAVVAALAVGHVGPFAGSTQSSPTDSRGSYSFVATVSGADFTHNLTIATFDSTSGQISGAGDNPSFTMNGQI